MPTQDARAVHVIEMEKEKCLDKGKKVVPEVMPIKKARVEEKPASMMSDSDDEATRKEKKRKKKAPTVRRKIGIKDFPLGAAAEPYDLIEDVVGQGPKLSWAQLLHLSPKLRRQWSKMVSTRKKKNLGAVSVQSFKDVLLVVDA